jgi:predicted transcriptional regulator
MLINIQLTHALEIVDVFRGQKRNKMQSRSLHSVTNCTAKQGGFMPTYWSAISLLNSDRAPEGTSGSEETMSS